MYALWCDVTDVRRDSCVVSCHVIWIDLNVCLVMSCDHLVAWIVRCRSITCDVPYTTRTYTTLTYTTLTYTCTTQVACDVQHIRVVLTSVTCHVSVALDPYKTHDHLRVIVVQYRVWCVTPHDTKHTAHDTPHTILYHYDYYKRHHIFVSRHHVSCTNQVIATRQATPFYYRTLLRDTQGFCSGHWEPFQWLWIEGSFNGYRGLFCRNTRLF